MKRGLAMTLIPPKDLFPLLISLSPLIESSRLTLKVNCLYPNIYLYLLCLNPSKKKKKNKYSQNDYSLCNIPKQTLVPCRLKADRAHGDNSPLKKFISGEFWLLTHQR